MNMLHVYRVDSAKPITDYCKNTQKYITVHNMSN